MAELLPTPGSKFAEIPIVISKDDDNRYLRSVIWTT